MMMTSLQQFVFTDLPNGRNETTSYENYKIVQKGGEDAVISVVSSFYKM